LRSGEFVRKCVQGLFERLRLRSRGRNGEEKFGGGGATNRTCTLGHRSNDHGKNDVTAAITKVLSSTTEGTVRAFDTIDNAPKERERGKHRGFERGVRNGEPPLRQMDCPGTRKYIKEYDHRRGTDGWRVLVAEATMGPIWGPPPAKRGETHSAGAGSWRSGLVIRTSADRCEDAELGTRELEVRRLLKATNCLGDSSP